ncbi:SNF2-related protein [Escherichia coli]|uniref:SNF2-related protein n=1 Tax=Aeromonas caviae TaxID=648 RepID=UPI00191F9AEB|nr:DEAD/DEAH box helicase [Aeromonas caviae]MBL0436818.1 DEAD/DEAH box helicase [Aeromonas caviae]MDX7853072.1 DEAD/DEAH box helicase [Aeromonas caviae]
MIIPGAFGRIEYVDRSWVIECEPQVRARLRRVFPKVSSRASEKIWLSATPENSRELDWFLSRYPMNMENETLFQLRMLATKHKEQERAIADLLQGERALPECAMAKPPRDYQREALVQLQILGGLLLADELGLGKTVSAMCPMTIPQNLPAVVVYPASLPNHWPEKLAEFMPGLRVHHVKKTSPYPLIKQPGQRTADLWDTIPDVILVSYHKLRGWAEVLGEIARYVVFEECQQLRNPDSDIYRACQYLSEKVTEKSGLKLGLTGTPIYNYGCEFFHVIQVLLPDSLGSYEEFVREWCDVGSSDRKTRLREPAEFGEYLRRSGIMLRRTRAEVGRELPPLTKIPYEIEMNKAVLHNMTSDAVMLAKTILAANERYRGERLQATGEFDRLMRQATGVAKAPFVCEFVRLLIESGQKVVLFGWHREVYNIWLEQLAEFNPVMYTGSESPKQKKASMDAFTNGDSKVIIVSLRAGAGIDGLQYASSTAVFGELDWAYGVMWQCIGRLFRDGQINPVMAYFLLADDGSDPIISEIVGIKRDQLEGVTNLDIVLTERVDVAESQLKEMAKRYLLQHQLAA